MKMDETKMIPPINTEGKFHCPYCEAEMVKEELGVRNLNGELEWFSGIRYICPDCCATGPMFDGDTVAIQRYPNNEYDNKVLREIANKQCDEIMVETEVFIYGRRSPENTKDCKSDLEGGDKNGQEAD